MTLVTDYTGITYVSDGQPDVTWNGVGGLQSPVIVTYSFVDGADVATYQANAAYANDGYSTMTAAQRTSFRAALAIYEKTAGIVFVETTSGDAMINAVNATGSSYGGWASTAYSTLGYTGSGELVIDNTGTYAKGSYAFQTILHELGHAMGLEHPFEGNITLDASVDNQAHTVMTYNIGSPYADHLGTLDVAAMQFLYGPAAATAGWALAMVAGVLQVTGSTRGDKIIGVAGANDLNGDLGNDSLFGRQSADTLHGGQGNDQLSGNGGGDKLYGEAGRDILYGFGTTNTWLGGHDLLFGGQGNDRLFGGFYGDKLQGGLGNDWLVGSKGDDTLNGGRGADSLYGGSDTGDFGSDVLYGEDGNDAMKGGSGSDTLYGGAQADRLWGDDGADSLFGGADDDTLAGGSGWDTLRGDDGNDLLYGGDGTNSLDGGAGNDTLIGGTSRDTLVGGAGDDVLTGTGGVGTVDYLTGGAGADRFIFLASDIDGEFRIQDFDRSADIFDMRALHIGFGDLVFQSGWFHFGSMWVQTSVALQLTADDFLF